jgi:hypothetical protein
MLTHELNNYTMQTAMDNYPKLVAAFKVCFFNFLIRASSVLTPCPARSTSSRSASGITRRNRT